MILDLHSHSVRSDDGRAQVENYCQWVRKRALPIDGFVLTEHRQFDFESDYTALAREHGLVILKASEVETDYGHVLVFGVTPALVAAFDFTSIRLPLAQVLEEAERHGAVAVPCHPGRTRVGMCAHVAERGPVAGVRIIEIYNGGSRGSEDEEAGALAERFGYQGIGGSDAHIVSHIGRCATRFRGSVQSEAELAEALSAGEFEAVSWEIEELKQRFLNLDFDERRFEVDPGAMIEFAAACGESAGRYSDPAHPEFQAAPTFCARFHGRRMLPSDFPEIGIPLDAGKCVMPQRPLRPGAKLVGKSHLHDIYEKTGRTGRMIFLVSRMELYDESETLVSIVDSRLVIRERPAA